MVAFVMIAEKCHVGQAAVSKSVDRCIDHGRRQSPRSPADVPLTLDHGRMTEGGWQRHGALEG
jgi:hypothetical protein